MYKGLVSGDSIISDATISAVAYGIALALLTVCFLVTLRALARGRARINGRVLKLLWTTAAVCGVVNAFGYPIFTRDFWFSIVWGRMIADGVNPYYVFATAADLNNTPLSPFQMPMTYGPLWGLMSAVLALIARGNGLAEFLLMKALLLAGWVWSLWLVGRADNGLSLAAKGIALCIFGWMPMSAHLTLAEGHNDIVLVAPLLLWLHLVVTKRRAAAPLPLVASVLIKYVTLPLVALEVWSAWKSGAVRSRAYLLAVSACAIFSCGILAIFVRDMEFLEETLGMRHWTFLSLKVAIFDGARYLGVSIAPDRIETGLRVLCGALILYYAFRYHRTGDARQLIDVVLVMFLAILWTVTGHIWPWFLMWVLGFCAIRPNTWLAC